ncbi:AlwI family type II restriction endonuclease [Effusibacillus lacus]|uniref:AlwI restriction endonuclease n=1 Tax=Effusibacillus lacus TaxID=1348429 RepID=A0A292YE44_9BACL|nr:AlwI family type II restriction endonuclease [Effusibacillus lacus]TCS75745.1 AlwI restriction endonuclease [Effusibacillus lacus]GAX91062.1 AlwI restriction endonuclease [Effusibacillus lacus]
MTLKAWYIGNTTVRNPSRLKEGLRVLASSSLHGNLIKKNQPELAKLLDREGIVDLKRSSEDDISDMGRKWKAALTQLGFLTPDPDTISGFRYEPYTITPNGRRLIEADTLPKEQECFLRALLAHQIPSDIEGFPAGPIFSPLRIVLEVLSGLGNYGLEPYISRNEMASIVMLTRSVEDIPEAINKIREFREEESRFLIPREKKRFYKAYRENVAANIPSQNADTIYTYADCNFRYLKLTGLFIERGQALYIIDHKKSIVEQILATPFQPIPENEYPKTLWNGAILPTDNAPNAIVAIQSLVKMLQENGQEVEVPDLFKMEAQDLSQYRLSLEDKWFKLLETRYAERQATEWADILNYLKELTQPRRGGIVPQGEAPAYFEWALWRAFLAINSLVNKPWEARRFKIDADFQPVGLAPGNGPDMVFEFEDFVVVAEVTLTASSRQEAAEGEPVRRHVAQYVDHYSSLGKKVYGLFIANKIDSNTAETFRIGVWYRQDDSRMALQIVPLTLSQFIELFEAGFASGRNHLDCKMIEQIIRDCLVDSNNEAPKWKEKINENVGRMVDRIRRIS